MAFATLQRLRDDLAAGRIDPNDAVAAAHEYVSSPVRVVREEAIELLATAAECDPTCGDAVANAVAERLRTGRGVSSTELRGVWAAGRAAPASMEPVVLALGRRLANVDRLRVETRHVRPNDDGSDGFRNTAGRALAVSVIGAVGGRAPGASKAAIPALVADCDASAESSVASESMWALVATATAEPAVLRPFVAGRVWALDETDPQLVATALDELGHVGASLPDHVPAVDRIRACLDHDAPRVREAAVRALGRLGGVPRYHGEPLGRALATGTDALVDPVTRRLRDGHPEVRSAAAGATECLARATPEAVADHHRRLDAVTNADDWLTRTNAARATVTVVERTGRVDDAAVDRLRALLADADPDVRRAARRGLCAALGASRDAGNAGAEDRRIAELLVVERFYDAGYASERSTDDAPDAVAHAFDVLGTDWVAPLADACRAHDDWTVRLRAVEIAVAAAERESDDPAPLARTLEAFLADGDRDVRERALEGLVAVADGNPGLSSRIARSVAAHATEGPGDLDASLPALAGLSDGAPMVVEAALSLVCRRRPDEEAADAENAVGDESTSDDDGGGMQDIVRDALDEHESDGVDGALATVADEAPGALTTITGDLVERTGQVRTAGTARALFAAVAEWTESPPNFASGDVLDRVRVESLLNLLEDPATPTEVQAWTAGTVAVAGAVGSADDRATAFARERLHSLIERDGTTAATAVVTQVAAASPADTAPFVPALLDEPDPDAIPEYARLIAASDEFVLPVTRALTRLPRELDEVPTSGLFEPLSATDWWPQIAPVLRASFPLATGVVASATGPNPHDSRTDHEAVPPWDLHPVPGARAVESDRTGGVADDPAAGDELDADDEPDRDKPADDDEPDLAALVGVGLAAARTATEPDAGSVRDNRDDRGTAWRRVVRAGLAADDPAVRRTAVRAADRVFAATAPDLDTGAALVEAVDDAEPTVRAAAVRVACRWGGSGTVDEDVLVDRVSALLAGSRLERRPACDGAADLLGRGAVSGERLLAEVRGQATAAERGVRRRAVAALGRAAAAGALPDSVRPAVLDRLSDAAVRGTLAVGVDAGGDRDDSRPAHAAGVLAETLVETERERSAHAVGRRLHRLSTTAPTPTRTGAAEALRAAIDGTERGDEGTLMLGYEAAAYWFCRVAAQLAAADRSAIGAFTTVVEGTLDRTAETGPDAPGSGELGRAPAVDGTALRRAALSAAGYGALEAFSDGMASALADTGDGESPLPDSAATAAFLRRADPDPRSAGVDALADADGGAYPATVVRSLAAAADDGERRGAGLTALAELAPSVTEPEATRDALAAATSAFADGSPTVRRRGVALIAALGERDRIPADEAVAHLLGVVRDADVRVRRDAADAIATIVGETYLGRPAVERIADRLAADLTTDAANGGILLAHALAVTEE
ncbi:hypothetical protein [Haloparvum sedimenti]|uniref:hypothetical protein n=1 Tax=Haloparvum sedimenti TaxID=1678448 RepID=UPI00071E8706|nr:hypothetical protein [Haloparvum sedimenti]